MIRRIWHLQLPLQMMPIPVFAFKIFCAIKWKKNGAIYWRNRSSPFNNASSIQSTRCSAFGLQWLSNCLTRKICYEKTNIKWHDTTVQHLEMKYCQTSQSSSTSTSFSQKSQPNLKVETNVPVKTAFRHPRLSSKTSNRRKNRCLCFRLPKVY